MRSINPSLRAEGQPVRFEIDRWELTAAQRNAQGEDGNAKFVRRAQQADATMTLLLRDLGQGTREELDGVLDNTDRDVAALWYVGRTEWPTCGVQAWLDARKDDIHFERCGAPGASENEAAISRVLTRWVLQATSRPPSDYDEDR